MSSSDSDQYEDLPNLKNKKFQVESDEEDDFDDDDDNGLDGQGAGDYDGNDLDDDEDEEKEGQNITAWGSQKKRFYQEGDEEASDDEAEEEEAKLIEKLQNEKLNQADFFDVFGDVAGEKQEDLADEDKEDDITGDSLKARIRSLENLADSEKLAFLKKESPELLNIIKELKTNLKEVKHRFLPLVSYFKNRKGENKEGQKYIELKFNLLMSYCMSLSFYILLNIQGKSVKDHPVIKKLITVRTMLGRLKPLDKKLQPEINQLLKDIQSTEKAAPVVQKPVVVAEKSIKQTKEKAAAKAKQNMFEEPKVQAKPVVAKKVEKQAPKELLAKRNRDELIKSNKKKVEEEDFSDSGDENADLYGGFGEDDDKDEGGLDEEDEFYRKIKQVKQIKRDTIAKEKQDKHAAKFEPNPSHFLEEEDVRGINRKIMKNKGLTRKRGKNHENNGRVKFKNRYEKAQYKHISQGKFVKEKTAVYSGESRAIKPGMIRSTKIGRQ
jgi:U3 small nucleolar RNA-associated protein 3